MYLCIVFQERVRPTIDPRQRREVSWKRVYSLYAIARWSRSSNSNSSGVRSEYWGCSDIVVTDNKLFMVDKYAVYGLCLRDA